MALDFLRQDESRSLDAISDAWSLTAQHRQTSLALKKSMDDIWQLWPQYKETYGTELVSIVNISTDSFSFTKSYFFKIYISL